MSAWIEAQRQWLARVAGAASAPGADLDSLRAPLIEGYQRLFTPEFASPMPASPALPDLVALGARYQAALQRMTAQVAAIANDAYQRFAASLASSDMALPPITRLRELHALWIECGEAAYAAAAHREEFADAQAAVLAALVELRGAARRHGA